MGHIMFITRIDKGRKEVGQGLVEYALALTLVSIVVIATLILLGSTVGNVFSPPAPDAPKKASYCIYMRPGASVAGMETNVAHPNAALNGFTNLPPDEW